MPIGPPTLVKGDIEVSATKSEPVVRRNENPTPIIKLVIPLPMIAAVTLKEPPLEKALMEQAQREDMSHEKGAVRQPVRAEIC